MFQLYEKHNLRGDIQTEIPEILGELQSEVISELQILQNIEPFRYVSLLV